jgi:hypothetical protein
MIGFASPRPQRPEQAFLIAGLECVQPNRTVLRFREGLEPFDELL